MSRCKPMRENSFGKDGAGRELEPPTRINQDVDDHDVIRYGSDWVLLAGVACFLVRLSLISLFSRRNSLFQLLGNSTTTH